ncbi:unnamed protein product, partial [marine sediment metagenome]
SLEAKVGKWYQLKGMLEAIAKSGTTQSTEIVVFFKRKIEQVSFN